MSRVQFKRTELIVFFFSLTLIVVSSARVATGQTGAGAKNVTSDARPQPETEKTARRDTSQTDASHSLTDAQKQAIKTIRAENEKKIAPTALRFALIVKQIYDNMLADTPDQELGKKLSEQMKDAAGELFTIRGQAFREAIKVLTPEQRQFLKSSMTKPGASADLLDTIMHTFNIPEK